MLFCSGCYKITKNGNKLRERRRCPGRSREERPGRIGNQVEDLSGPATVWGERLRTLFDATGGGAKEAGWTGADGKRQAISAA